MTFDRTTLKEELMRNLTVRFRLVLCATVLSSFLTLVPVHSAQGQSCGCSICGCFRNHPGTGECNVPAVEPCDCWVCLS